MFLLLLFLITFSQLSANPQMNYQSFSDGQSFIKNQIQKKLIRTKLKM